MGHHLVAMENGPFSAMVYDDIWWCSMIVLWQIDVFAVRYRWFTSGYNPTISYLDFTAFMGISIRYLWDIYYIYIFVHYITIRISWLKWHICQMATYVQAATCIRRGATFAFHRCRRRRRGSWRATFGGGGGATFRGYPHIYLCLYIYTIYIYYIDIDVEIYIDIHLSTCK